MTIKLLLSELLDGKWWSLATFSEPKACLLADAIPIPPCAYRLGGRSEGIKVEVGPALVSRRPVTNSDYARFLNEVGIENHADGTYLLCNDINVNMPIQRAADGSYEVTDPAKRDHPVIGVTWYGALLYASVLGGRLPTEAEWEVVARSGDADRRFPWGDREPTERDGNHSHHVGGTTPWNAYPATEWGALDMAGNVRQWCLDWFTKRLPYMVERGLDVPAEERVMKVVRGGVWSKGTHLLACDVRRGKWMRMGSTSCGFRVAFDTAERPARPDTNRLQELLW